jgi:hypothetical protein
MENVELRSTLVASWCAANLIRLNLEKLIYIEDLPNNPPTDYARWASIGHLLLRPEAAQDRECRLHALWEMVDLFCDLVNNMWCGELDEVKDESAKGQANTALVVDLAAFRDSKRDGSST